MYSQLINDSGPAGGQRENSVEGRLREDFMSGPGNGKVLFDIGTGLIKREGIKVVPGNDALIERSVLGKREFGI